MFRRIRVLAVFVGIATLATGSCSLNGLDDLKGPGSDDAGDSDAGSDAPSDGPKGDKPVGSACGNGSECDSGHCVTGVCCKSACSGPCEACSSDLTGTAKDGECAPVPAGTDPLDRCEAAAESTCGTDGKCDGKGACRLHAAGIECQTQSCANGVKTLAGTCDGKGSCQDGGSVECQPKTCNGAVCASDCPNDAACNTGEYCDIASGKCTPKRANGSACQAAKPNECTSGFCADGVCCGSVCTGACQACTSALSGKPDGECGNVPGGSDPDGDCADQGAPSCGNDGACNGNGACRLYASGTACGAAGCAGSSTQSKACDGAGSCKTNTLKDCAPYACGAGSCTTSCNGSANCASGAACDPVTHQCLNHGVGCRTGQRTGFTDVVAWPNIASCGTLTSFTTAVAQAATTCDDGWHMCNPADLGALPSTVPDAGLTWLNYTGPGPQMWTLNSNTTCGAFVSTANLAGTGGCTAAGLYPEGWRLALSATVWGFSHDSAVGCIPHVSHVCAFPGGQTPAQAYTTCCR